MANAVEALKNNPKTTTIGTILGIAAVAAQAAPEPYGQIATLGTALLAQLALVVMAKD